MAESANAHKRVYKPALKCGRTGGVFGFTPYDVNDLVHSIPVGDSGVVVLFDVELDAAANFEVALMNEVARILVPTKPYIFDPAAI